MIWWGSPTHITFLILHFITSKKLIQAHFANSLPPHNFRSGRFNQNFTNSSTNCSVNPLMCQNVTEIPLHQPVLQYAQPTLTARHFVPQYQSAPPYLTSNHQLLHSSQRYIQYVNPVNSYYNYNWSGNNNLKRVEEGGHEEGHNKGGHEKGHEMMEVHGHGETEMNHHEHNHGWGWGEMKAMQKHIPHKKKKGKKGALAKILNKFRPKSKKRQPLVWKEERECDGWENFLKDLEIISWILGIIGFIKASVAFLLHIINQTYGFFSIVKIGLPERLTTFVDLIAPGTTPETIRTIIAILGLLDYLVTFFASYPLGNLIVLIDGIAEALTIPSLALATFTIFDDLVEEKIWSIFGIDVRDLFDGYGCPSSNPFSKEKKIEQFFEELTSILSGEKEKESHKGWGWGKGMEKRRRQSIQHHILQ